MRGALGVQATVWLSGPATLTPATGLVQDLNILALSGHVLDRGTAAALGRVVRANVFPQASSPCIIPP